MKLSYCCMPYIQSFIDYQNKKILNKNPVLNYVNVKKTKAAL